MSPVSRSRTKKKPRGAAFAARSVDLRPPFAAQRSGKSVLGELMERIAAEKPERMQSLTSVLDDSEALLTASGPCELEQAACVLIGEELYEFLYGDAVGRSFGVWFMDLVDAALERIASLHASEKLADGGWQGPYFLLHAMAGLGSPEHGARAASAAKTAEKLLGKAVTGLPPWLYKLRKQTATGELWQLTDVYGGRHGVIAGFTYPGGKDASVYLFDIDTAIASVMASGGVHDNAEQAAAAWRETVGPDAADARLSPVADPGELYPLAYLEVGAEFMRGDESRNVLDEYYRVQRRLDDVYVAVARRRTPLPKTVDLYNHINIQPVVDEFSVWYAARHDADPDSEAVEALAEEWIEGCTPGTEHLISPARVRHICALVHDWDDDPITDAARALLPDWIRWHGEARDLPSPLIENAVALVTALERELDDDRSSR